MRIDFSGRLAALFAEKLCFSDNAKKNMRLCRRSPTMFQISRDNPAFYLTSVTNNRLPVFRTDAIKQIVANAFDEARKSASILIFAYVIMPDHTHLLTDNARDMSDVLRFINGISARRVINHLKLHGYDSSLSKLRIQERKDRQKYSLYEHHPNGLRITGEDAFMQKLNYIYMNPVRAGLVRAPGRLPIFQCKAVA